MQTVTPRQTWRKGSGLDQAARPKRRLWSVAEVLLLQQAIARTSFFELAEELQRQPSAVCKKARALGLALADHHRRFPADRALVLGGPQVARRAGDIYWPEEDEEICRLRNAGFTIGEIANQLERTGNSIKTRIRRLKITNKYHQPNWVDVQTDYDNGVKIKEIEKKYNTSRYRMSKNISLHKRRHTALDDEEKELIVEKYMSGCTLKCITNSLGRSDAAITKYLSDTNLEAQVSEEITDIISFVSNLLENGFTARSIGQKLDISLRRAARLVSIVRNLEVV